MSSSNSWNLFGYDVSRAWHFYLAGWREFVWSSSSPLRKWFDESVEVYGEGSQSIYRSGVKASGVVQNEKPASKAVIVPEEIVLFKTLVLPVEAEIELDSIVSIELQALSPFSENDTCSGWQVLKRDGQTIEVLLAISSIGAVMEHIGREYDSHNPAEFEVWGCHEGRIVEFRGFGEVPRRDRYRRTVIRNGLFLTGCIMLILLMLGVGAGINYVELGRWRAEYREVQNSAEVAMLSRDRISDMQQTLVEIEALISESPDVLDELSKVTKALDDGTWIIQFDLNSQRVRIDGQSSDAARVMQDLSESGLYAQVTSPVAIRKVGRTNLERFVLDLKMADVSEAQ